MLNYIGNLVGESTNLEEVIKKFEDKKQRKIIYPEIEDIQAFISGNKKKL